MIRLDGNSLAAFRGAGVAGTVQSVAGCELFGAARMPSWTSPYSAAATRALKAQFPTQWPTIRDYGFSHPEIVGYMNAYAPEDAKIAYSLVEGIGHRYIYGTGTQYINTNYLLSSNEARINIEYLQTDNVNLYTSMFGTEKANQDTNWVTAYFGANSGGSNFSIYLGSSPAIATYASVIGTHSKFDMKVHSNGNVEFTYNGASQTKSWSGTI